MEDSIFYISRICKNSSSAWHGTRAYVRSQAAACPHLRERFSFSAAFRIRRPPPPPRFPSARSRSPIDRWIDRSIGFRAIVRCPSESRRLGNARRTTTTRKKIKRKREEVRDEDLAWIIRRSFFYIYRSTAKISDGPSGLLSRTSEAPSPRFLFSLATPPVVVICANNSIIIKSLVHVIIYIFSILHSSNVGNSYSRRDGEEQREGTDPYRLEMCEAKFLDAESNRIESLKHNF